MNKKLEGRTYAFPFQQGSESRDDHPVGIIYFSWFSISTSCPRRSGPQKLNEVEDEELEALGGLDFSFQTVAEAKIRGCLQHLRALLPHVDCKRSLEVKTNVRCESRVPVIFLGNICSRPRAGRR